MNEAQKNKQIAIFVEGNIGVGKTTFLRFLENNFNACIMYEENELWQNIGGYDLLQEFFLDNKRWAYTLQNYITCVRVDQLLKVKCQINDYSIRVIERSIYSGRYCFAQVEKELGAITNMEWELYKQLWQREHVKLIECCMGFIYLRIPYDDCYARIMKRGRVEENNISLEYLKALETKYDDWFIHKKGVDDYVLNYPCLVLDFSRNIELDKNMQQEYLTKIREFSIAL